MAGAIVAPRVYAFQTGTVNNSTAKSLLDFGFSAAEVAKADVVLISVEAQTIRYRLDGTAPTSTVGHPEAVGSFSSTGKDNNASLKIISTTGTATLQISLATVSV